MKRGTQAPAPYEKRTRTKFPPHEPTDELRKKVKMLAAVGMTQDEIAIIIDTSEPKLKKLYAPQLRAGMLEADAEVAQNLYRMATGTGPEAGRTAIFWMKVRRRWHEVQRVIHGYDPETISGFVKGVVAVLRRLIPKACPHCHAPLDLPQKVAAELQVLSQRLAESLPPSEIVPMPRPELASDGLEPGGS